MRRAERLGPAAALVLGLAGCSVWPAAPDSTPLFRDPALTVQQAREALTPGTSTRQDVAARLGPAEALRFDSGYEVWAYRARGGRRPGAGAELVLLFDPAGVLRKVRALPAPPPSQG